MASKWREIEVHRFDAILTFLSTSPELDLENFDLILYGGGGQTKKFYRDLGSDKDVELLWTGWPGPKWTSFLSFIPGQAGLIKILNQQRLKSLFEELATFNVSDLYYVEKRMTFEIVDAVRSAPSWHNPRRILQKQTRFIYLQTEMDETVTRNGKEHFVFDLTIGVDLAV